MYWLAEQGLAPKRVFLVIISLILFIVTKLVKTVFIYKEDEKMKSNKHNTIDLLNVFNSLSGNMAGGALLTNALYGNVELQG